MSRRFAPPALSRRGSLLATGMAAVLLLGACGSDDNAGGSTSSPAATSPAGNGSAGTGSAESSAAESSLAESSPAESSPAESSPAESGSVGSSPAESGTGESGPAESGSGAAPALDEKGCITDFDPSVDYFDDKQEVEFAQNFSISYEKSYQVVTVTPPGGAAERYVFVRCGADQPELTGDLADAQVVTTPVTSLYSGSTTHLPALTELDQLDVLTGVASGAFVTGEQAVDHISANKVPDFAPTGAIDAEAVVAGQPEVLVNGGFPDEADQKLIKAGIPVLQDLDASEEHPLGQAEWIKFFAALTGTEGKADVVFDQIADDYEKTAALVADAEPVQLVPGQPYQGTWYVPGGKTWKTELFTDAGGTTAWVDDESTTSVTTDFETVFGNSGKAPVWLASTTWATEADALAEEPRFSKFTAFAEHNVWNPILGANDAGGNPYYELGAARPDLVLADMIAILHPDLLSDHEFTFFQKLT